MRRCTKMCKQFFICVVLLTLTNMMKEERSKMLFENSYKNNCIVSCHLTPRHQVYGKEIQFSFEKTFFLKQQENNYDDNTCNYKTSKEHRSIYF